MRTPRITFPSRRGGGTSGGASLSDPNVAYLRSDGNDGTGEIGNPGKPYLTMQAAYDDGARNFDLGIGDFGTLTLAAASNDKIRFIGRGAPTLADGVLGWSAGSIFEVDATAATQATFVDLGNKSAFIKEVTGLSNTLVFFSARVGPIDASPPTADNGARGGDVNGFDGCVIQSITCVSNNGTPGTSEDPGGNGGGATVQLVDCRVIGAVTCKAGIGGSDGGAGPGNNGSGLCSLTRSNVSIVTTEFVDGDVKWSIIGTPNVSGGHWAAYWNYSLEDFGATDSQDAAFNYPLNA